MTRLKVKTYNTMKNYREAAKISALSSGKIYKCEYLTSEKILPSSQKQTIEQAKFTYSSLRKSSEKQTKTIEDQWRNQICAIKDGGKQIININAIDYKNDLIINFKRKKYLRTFIIKHVIK